MVLAVVPNITNRTPGVTANEAGYTGQYLKESYIMNKRVQAFLDKMQEKELRWNRYR